MSCQQPLWRLHVRCHQSAAARVHQVHSINMQQVKAAMQRLATKQPTTHPARRICLKIPVISFTHCTAVYDYSALALTILLLHCERRPSHERHYPGDGLFSCYLFIICYAEAPHKNIRGYTNKATKLKYTKIHKKYICLYVYRYTFLDQLYICLDLSLKAKRCV